MKQLKSHKLLLVFTLLSNFVCLAQNAVVQERVVTPLAEPTGTNYSAKSLHFHVGYVIPLFNENQKNILFWNSGGYHVSLASSIALNKRIGLGYQIGYTRLHYGKTTNDSLGNTFFSDKAVSNTNLVDASIFTRIFLGKTYFKPSLDLGVGINYNFNTRIVHQGTYIPTNTSGGLKYQVEPNQIFPAHAMMRLNLQKIYLNATYFFNPLFSTTVDEIKWQTQLGVGLRF